MRHEPLGIGALGHAPREIVAAEADVEQHPPALGIGDLGQYLPVLVQRAARIAVIDMGYHVAGLGDLEGGGGGDLRWRLLEFADMDIGGNTEYFGQALADPQRPGAGSAERAELEIAKYVAMGVGEVHPVGDRDIHQATGVALYVIDPDQPHRSQPQPGIEIGDGAPLHHGEEFVEGSHAGSAGFDEAGYALPDAETVGIGKSERAVCVNVDIDETGADIMPTHIDDVAVVRRRFAHRDDLAVFNDHIRDLVDRVGRIDDMSALQDRSVRVRLAGHPAPPRFLFFDSTMT